MSGGESYVGRAVPRVEDLRLLSGTGAYGADVNREGQLHARVVRSDVPFGRLKGVDASAASERPGVVRVVTAADFADQPTIPIRMFPGPEGERVLQTPLATDTVRYVGEPVAVVVAEDPYVAEDAADEVELDIEPLDPVLEASDAADEGAPTLHPDLGKNVVDREVIRHGEDVESLFAEAAAVVRRRLRIQRHGAVPLEPRALVAEFDPDTGQVSVWGAAKVKHFNRRCLAALLGIDVESVRLIEVDVGGGFGGRGEFYPEDFLIPWLAIELGRPVKWVEDRRENLTALNQSRNQDWAIEMAAAADGTLLGYRARGWWNQGGYVRTHGSYLLPRLTVNHFRGPYRWRGFETEAATVMTNKTPAGTYRGPGQFEGTYLRERMLDILAAELGVDPVELRRRNLISVEEMPYETGLPDIDSREPLSYVEGDYSGVFEAALERAGYEELRAEVDARRARGERVGIGVACFAEMGGPGPFEQARIGVESDGTFTVHVGVASVGQGVQTVLAQVTADVLGVPIERVAVSHHDTAVIPEGLGAFSSRATLFGGNAAAGAARTLLDSARRAAAERFGVGEDEIEIEAGVARVSGGGAGEGLALFELGELDSDYRYEPSRQHPVVPGANLAMVELDPRTGEARLLSSVVAVEIGRAINPLTLEGQMVGAAAQAVGGALFEEFAYSPDGQPLSTSFLDYAMPTAAEIPEVTVELLELDEISPDDPLAGARGGGESGIVGSGAAIANAVADALGEAGGELTDLPITPETIQRAAATESVETASA